MKKLLLAVACIVLLVACGKTEDKVFVQAKKIIKTETKQPDIVFDDEHNVVIHNDGPMKGFAEIFGGMTAKDYTKEKKHLKFKAYLRLEDGKKADDMTAWKLVDIEFGDQVTEAGVLPREMRMDAPAEETMTTEAAPEAIPAPEAEAAPETK